MRKSVKYSIFFGVLGALFYIPFLGGVHLFDWDEVNFAEISREMVVLHEYLRIYVNYVPFWEKPPFFFWMQVLAMKIFGVGEFAARFPNALIGIATLVVLYNTGKKLYNNFFGLIWAGVYFGTVLPFLYFKSGIIDPYFNFFIFLGLYFVILFYWKKDKYTHIDLPRNYWFYLMLGGLFIGMGILTKGPVALLIAMLTMFVYWIFKRFRFYMGVHHFLFFFFCTTLVSLAWYGLETLKHGPWFIKTFNIYQYRLFSTPDAGHAGFPGYHFVVLLVGCFPASIFCLRAFFKTTKEEYAYRQDFRLWMKILFWVVLILFTIVKSKIVHYSSMCYFPLTFLAALVVYKIINREINFNNWMKTGLAVIGGLYIVAILIAPYIGNHIELIKPLFEKDPFAVANLNAHVKWTGLEVIPGLLLLALIIFTFRMTNKGQYRQAFATLFGGTGVFVMLTLIFFIGRIEMYSQNAEVKFMINKAKEDAYIIPYGYKTYTHLFYGKKKKPENPQSYDQNWLLTDDIDKDVYIITKIHKAHELEDMEGLHELGEKNGYVFFKRKCGK